MLNQAGLPSGIRQGVLAEAANMAVFWENALVHTKGQLPAYTQFYNKDPKYINNLHPFEAKYINNLHLFGEIRISVDPKFKKIHAKLQNKGQLCMMLGPAEHHGSDTFRMLNIATKKVVITRDILWLNKFYSTYYKTVMDDFDKSAVLDDDLIAQDAPIPDNVGSGMLDNDSVGDTHIADVENCHQGEPPHVEPPFDEPGFRYVG